MAEDWLVELAGGDDAVVYVFPPGGSGAAAVTDLATRLPGVRVVAVRLPGRESLAHLPCVTDVDLVASRLAADIAADAGPAPVVLFGHCAGAVVAYEVATLLDRDHVGLVVSAHASPDRIPRPGAWTWPDEQFLDQVARDGFLPDEVREDPDLLDLCLPALRGDYEAIETHQASGEVLEVPVTALLGDGDRDIAEADVAAWAAFTTAGFALRHVPGAGHNLLLDAPDDVARELIRVATNLPGSRNL